MEPTAQGESLPLALSPLKLIKQNEVLPEALFPDGVSLHSCLAGTLLGGAVAAIFVCHVYFSYGVVFQIKVPDGQVSHTAASTHYRPFSCCAPHL